MDSGFDKPTILIVEDDATVRRGLSQLFQLEGYRTVEYPNGLEALARLRNQAEAELPAAAVIDVHLPDISGLVLSSELRKFMGDERPIIVLSGDVSMEVLNSLSHVGATYFFSKPVSSTQLIERMRELVA